MAYRNRLATKVSAVASSGLGDFTVSGAVQGYRTFTATENAESFNITITEGVYWEVRTGCVYTHSTKTLTRGTLENSSSGVGVAFSPSCTIINSPPATFFNEIGILPQNSKSANYTTVLSDAKKHIFHPSADTTARTITIDSNANVPYPIGTEITFVNQNAAGNLTIAITSDTMRLAGDGSTGSKILAANGRATALKVASTEWILSGIGLSSLSPTFVGYYEQSSYGGDVTVGTHNAGDILILFERGSYYDTPALKSGYTDILVEDGYGPITWRISYIIDASNSISTITPSTYSNATWVAVWRTASIGAAASSGYMSSPTGGDAPALTLTAASSIIMCGMVAIKPIHHLRLQA